MVKDDFSQRSPNNRSDVITEWSAAVWPHLQLLLEADGLDWVHPLWHPMTHRLGRWHRGRNIWRNIHGRILYIYDGGEIVKYTYMLSAHFTRELDSYAALSINTTYQYITCHSLIRFRSFMACLPPLQRCLSFSRCFLFISLLPQPRG